VVREGAAPELVDFAVAGSMRAIEVLDLLA
jgi:hypothetical protein